MKLTAIILLLLLVGCKCDPQKVEYSNRCHKECWPNAGFYSGSSEYYCSCDLTVKYSMDWDQFIKQRQRGCE